MRRRRPFRHLTLGVAAAGLLSFGLTTIPGGSPAQAAISAPELSLPTTTSTATIPVRDGVTLAATIAKPLAGTWPIVIMPGTFAGDAISVIGIAQKLAARGFVTVTYTERGFGKSTGGIDAGGPKDVSDVSDVLDWTLANTGGDGSRVGLASISYGSGFLPMVAVNDSRFTALAMISGWGDMWQSRFPNDTPAFASNVALYGLALSQGKLSPEADSWFKDAIAGKMTPAMRRYAAVRSPSNYLPQLQKNHPPLYMSTSMNEMIWPDDQTIKFYDAYPGVKHLDVLPGDHATTELGQIAGIPGVTWSTAFDWLDAYVAGANTTAKSLPAVRIAPRGPAGTNVLQSGLFENWPFEPYASVAAATGTAQRQYLNTTASGPFGLFSTTSLAATPGTGTTSLREGENTLLQNGIPMIQGGFEVVTGAPSTVPLDLVDRGVTGVFTGSPLASEVKLRGAAKAHLVLTPSAAKGSVFVYLLERAPDNGSTYVIAFKPYSWTGATPGTPMALDIPMGYNAYNVPAGHSLITAVSTGDVLYSDSNPAFSTEKIGPGSYIDLPVR